MKNKEYTCPGCGKLYTKYRPDEDKCFMCQLHEHRGFDKVTEEIMDKTPIPDFFVIKGNDG